jgi:hypothetical protein
MEQAKSGIHLVQDEDMAVYEDVKELTIHYNKSWCKGGWQVDAKLHDDCKVETNGETLKAAMDRLAQLVRIS